MRLATARRWTAGLSRTIFVLYIVFLLVGPNPLQDDEVRDTSTSNIVNQAVDSLLPALAAICLVSRRRALLRLVQREKFLTVFLVWSLLSVSWSEFPINSAKAAVRLLGSTVVIAAFLLNAGSVDEALSHLRRVFAIYIPVSFLAVAFLPYAIQWEWPAWRGIADGKNTLGQISVISAVVWAIAFCRSSAGRRLAAALFLGGSVILLLGSKSTTALIALLVLSVLAGYVFVERHVRRLGISRVAPITMAVSVLLLFVVANALDIGTATMAFGKDDTFTGRTDIWREMRDEASGHPYLGVGYAGFWIPESPKIQRLWQDDIFPWRPNEGHEGYLDVLNETGAVGLAFLAFIVMGYFTRLVRLKDPHVWQWLFIPVLVFNLTESTIFRVGQFSGWIFLLSYLALHVELLRSDGTIPLAA